MLFKPAKLITCILPRGDAKAVSQLLFDEYDIKAMSSFSGRGQSGPMTGHDWNEKDLLTVMVPVEEADTIFELLCRLVGVNEQHGRMVFQADAPLSTQSILPVIEAQEQETE